MLNILKYSHVNLGPLQAQQVLFTASCLSLTPRPVEFKSFYTKIQFYLKTLICGFILQGQSYVPHSHLKFSLWCIVENVQLAPQEL